MKMSPAKQDAQAYLKAIGWSIREQRKRCSMSQEALALAAEIDRSHMGKIERGERNLTTLKLIRIAHALSCCPSDLLRHAGL